MDENYSTSQREACQTGSPGGRTATQPCSLAVARESQEAKTRPRGFSPGNLNQRTLDYTVDTVDSSTACSAAKTSAFKTLSAFAARLLAVACESRRPQRLARVAVAWSRYLLRSGRAANPRGATAIQHKIPRIKFSSSRRLKALSSRYRDDGLLCARGCWLAACFRVESRTKAASD